MIIRIVLQAWGHRCPQGNSPRGALWARNVLQMTALVRAHTPGPKQKQPVFPEDRATEAEGRGGPHSHVSSPHGPHGLV